MDDFMIESSSGKKYAIKQIKDSRELFEEGTRLNHCIYSYTEACVSGSKFIFFLREIYEDNSEHSLITIEVLKNTIKQARGNYNRLVYKNEFVVIEKWANENNLKLGFFHRLAV